MSSSSDQSTGGLPSPQNIQAEIEQTIGTDDDRESALGSDATIRSKSVTSSIYNYQYENGRRYHAYRAGQYLLPNDEAEQDRLDLRHHIFRLVLGGRLFCAPIVGKPQRVLDFGTGTGAWAIDLADELPSAIVYGTDLSPIQPSAVPPNCQFYIDDFESEWTFGPDEAFDFIHGRGISGCVSNFSQLYSRIYRNLKPGAWVEIQEYEFFVGSDDDPNLEKAPCMAKWISINRAASAKFGKSMSIAQDQQRYMIDAGFQDVRDHVHKIPIGIWPADPKLKELGLYQRELLLLSVESFTPGHLGRVDNWSMEECQVIVAEVRREVLNPKLHLYSLIHFVVGRKPRAADTDHSSI